MNNGPVAKNQSNTRDTVAGFSVRVTASNAMNGFLRRVRAVARVIGVTIIHIFLALCVAWGTFAIIFSGLAPQFAWPCAAAFATLGIWSLWSRHPRHVHLLFPVLLVIVLMLWSRVQPSHERDWRPEVAVMPRATMEGDRVRITGVRNFVYGRDQNEFVPHYEDREVALSHLQGVDYFISYWMPGPIAHTFVSFVFDNAAPLSISIEARPEKGEGYSPLGSLFKQFELIYVVGDERDLVRVRTNYRHEQVFLYRIQMPPEVARRLFLVYLTRINELADRPEFYHLLANSCTVNIVRYASAASAPLPFDIRYYLNGLSDRFLYRTGRLETGMAFEQLRLRAHINALAHAASNEDFSKQIRATLKPSRVASPIHGSGVASEKARERLIAD